jgi:hypothetical protein
MAGTDIATGVTTAHGDTVLPTDASMNPGVAPVGFIQPGQLEGPTIPGRDCQGEYAATMAAAEAECHAALPAGMAAENQRRHFYEQDIAPQAADYGIEMQLPPPRDDSLPPMAALDGYPWEGLQPKPPEAGFYHAGNEPQ